MPFLWAFVRPALLASGHKKTTELIDSPWFVLIKPTFVRLGCGKTGIRTLGTRKGTTVFETVPIDHSGIFPRVLHRKGTKVFRHGEIFLAVSMTECGIFLPIF